MGKNNKKEQEEQLRAYREAEAKKIAEERAKQNRLIAIISVVSVLVAAGAIVLAIFLSGVFSNETETEPETETEIEETVTPFENLVTLDSLDEYYPIETVTDYVCMEISYTDKDGNAQSGKLVLGLDETSAPISAAHFKELVAADYYDGLTFGRVYPDFMIQGGFAGTDNDGSDASTITGEFSANGYDNPISHTRGVLSWARTKDYDSASGQFFIVHKDSTHLDGQYAGFGTVLVGMELVDAICNIELTDNNNGIDSVNTKPVYPVTIEKAYFVAPGGDVFS